jgi:hypothetical protein
MSIRPVKRLVAAKPTVEGAGVHLRRAFGFGNTTDFDPFLLLDDFRNDVPRTIWRDSRGTRTAALKRLRMCWREPWSTATAWGIMDKLLRATCSG